MGQCNEAEERERYTRRMPAGRRRADAGAATSHGVVAIGAHCWGGALPSIIIVLVGVRPASRPRMCVMGVELECSRYHSFFMYIESVYIVVQAAPRFKKWM